MCLAALPLITDFTKDLSYSLRISVSPLNIGNIRRIVEYLRPREYFPQLPDDVQTSPFKRHLQHYGD